MFCYMSICFLSSTFLLNFDLFPTFNLISSELGIHSVQNIAYFKTATMLTSIRDYILIHSQKKQNYYSYIGSYLKAIRAIAAIWNSILCLYSGS